MGCPACGSDWNTYLQRCSGCGLDHHAAIVATGVVYGTRRTAAPAHGSADPSSGDGTGTRLTATQVAAAQQAAYARIAATLGNRPGLTVGVPVFASGAFMQPHPLARPGAITWLGVDPAAEKPRQPLETAPISVGEFVGWRIWLVRPADRLLQSYSAGRIWLPGEPMTGQPSDRGGEGVWAFKEANRAGKKLVSERMPGVLGSVWLWGRVIEHRDGFRAEFAEIRSLDYLPRIDIDPDHPPAASGGIFFARRDGPGVSGPPSDDAMLTALRQRYGVGSAAEIAADEAA